MSPSTERHDLAHHGLTVNHTPVLEAIGHNMAPTPSKGSDVYTAPMPRKTLSDAILILIIADQIHGTDEAIRRAGKNVVKKLPRSKRNIIYDLISSPRPKDLIRVDQVKHEIGSSQDRLLSPLSSPFRSIWHTEQYV